MLEEEIDVLASYVVVALLDFEPRFLTRHCIHVSMLFSSKSILYCDMKPASVTVSLYTYHLSICAVSAMLPYFAMRCYT